MYERIYEAFKAVSGCSFNIWPSTDNTLSLRFRRGSEQWIRADSCGQGLSDLLVIIYFVLEPDSTFVMIEEPENHMHPEMQGRLLRYLDRVKSKQFFLSTHSNVFLDPRFVDRVYYTEFTDSVHVSDQTSRSRILTDLGYSIVDHVAADAIVLTEGRNDVRVLRTVCDWLGLTEHFSIRFWPLGGDNMQYHDLSIFGHMANVVAIVDSDPGSHTVRTRFARNCAEHGIPCTVLSHYSVENYFSLDAIKRNFPKAEITLTEIKPDTSVDEQIGFPEGKSVKSKIDGILANMTLSDVEGTDLLKACEQIGEVCTVRDGRQSMAEATERPRPA
jgi:hypothetical protein